MLSPASVREVEGVTRERFENEVTATAEPVVMRGLVRHWPMVAAGLESNAALSKYLTGFDSGAAIGVMAGPPSIDGRLFYKEDHRSLNFQKRETPFTAALQAILAAGAQPSRPTIYISGASTAKHWPNLMLENPLALLPDTVIARLWIGTEATVGPHNDDPENIACVVAGRRRFRVFPPEQFANLYVGPIEFNPAGRPVSFVSVSAPELDRYPRYARALEASREALLEPGDAIYIPSLWWHSVESLAPLNVLANYWWDLPAANPRQAEAALIHALLTIAPLTARQRLAWKAVFEHLVFRIDGDPVAHIPPEIRGWLADLSPDLRDRMRSLIRQRLME